MLRSSVLSHPLQITPRESAQVSVEHFLKVKTSPQIVALVDELLGEHLYAEIAEILNAKGFHPGGSAWPGKHSARFTALRVQYLVHTYVSALTLRSSARSRNVDEEGDGIAT